MSGEYPFSDECAYSVRERSDPRLKKKDAIQTVALVQRRRVDVEWYGKTKVAHGVMCLDSAVQSLDSFFEVSDVEDEHFP